MLSFITKARVCSTKHLPEMLSHDLDLKMFLSRNQFNQKWWQNIEIFVLCLAHRVSSLLANTITKGYCYEIEYEPWPRSWSLKGMRPGKRVVEHSFSFSVSISAEETKNMENVLTNISRKITVQRVAGSTHFTSYVLFFCLKKRSTLHWNIFLKPLFKVLIS